MLRKVKSWISGLSKTGKVTLIALAVFGFFGLVNAASSPASDKVELTSSETEDTQQVKSEQAPEPSEPKIEKKTFTEIEEIPFDTTTVDDPDLKKGETAIRTTGVTGTKTLTYEQTFTDGEPGEKVLVKEEVTTEPVTQVKAVGTKVAVVPKPRPSNCDPNYSGACVPIASDVDCVGGSGNGPAYVSGPVYVEGYDIYDLDRDGNGVGCE